MSPYKRRDPAPESEMNRTRWEGHYSICQFLRDIYHLAGEENVDREQIRLKCRIGISMTKAMNERLKYYRHKYDEQLDMPEFEEEEARNASKNEGVSQIDSNSGTPPGEGLQA